MTIELTGQAGDVAGTGGVESAAAVFSGESLRMPFVPERLAVAVRSRGALVFGTREAEEGLYALEHYVSELEQPGLGDYLLMGFDGHGMVSQGLHYYLVSGPLALFLQLSYGNPFADEATSRRRIDGALGLAEQLYRDIADAEKGGKFPSGQRLVVVESDFSSSRWGWVVNGDALVAENTAHALLDGLMSVRKLLA